MNNSARHARPDMLNSDGHLARLPSLMRSSSQLSCVNRGRALGIGWGGDDSLRYSMRLQDVKLASADATPPELRIPSLLSPLTGQMSKAELEHRCAELLEGRLAVRKLSAPVRIPVSDAVFKS